MRIKGFELAAGFVLLASLAFSGSEMGHAAASAEQLSTTGAAAAASGVFADLAGHWAASAVSAAVYKEYVDGYPDGTFKPEQSVTRAEFVKMAVTALKLPLGPAGGVWYDTYVRGAVSAGIYKYDFASGTWDDPITREEMAMLSARAAVKEVNEAASYDKKKYMYAATKAGLIQGMDDRGTLGMDQPTTRAQSVTVIERVLTVNGGGKLAVDKHAVGNAELVWHKTNIFTVMPEYFNWNRVDTGSLSYNPDNLSVETPDGKYRGELDQIVAIDMEDPNDPNRGLLPDINILKWYNWISEDTSFAVKDYPESYIMYFKSHIDYNKDASIYGNYNNYLLFSMGGIKSPDRKLLMSGTLNGVARVFINQAADTPAYIIPKNGTVLDGTIDISIYSSAIPPNPDYTRTILRVYNTPTQ